MNKQPSKQARRRAEISHIKVEDESRCGCIVSPVRKAREYTGSHPHHPLTTILSTFCHNTSVSPFPLFEVISLHGHRRRMLLIFPVHFWKTKYKVEKVSFTPYR